MKSAEIVEAISTQQRQVYGASAVYRREWSIGVGQTRVDLGVINGRITGFEIKAAGDDLARLPKQAELYSAVVDRAVLVVERLRTVERAMTVIPDWWGVWQMSSGSGDVCFNRIRGSRSNPTPHPLAIAQLLWRDEALQLLDDHQLAVGLRTSTRWRLWERLAEALPLPELRREVCDAIRARPGW